MIDTRRTGPAKRFLGTAWLFVCLCGIPTSALFAQVDWELHGIVLPGGDPTVWDGVISSPQVIRDEEDSGYRLFYRGWPLVRIGNWASNVSWANAAELAGPWARSDVFSLESSLFQGSIASVEIVRDPPTGIYRAYVTFAALGGDFRLEVRLATSNDLDQWDWWSPDPVFAGELPWEITLFNEVELPSVGQPSIVVRGEEYHMWYYGTDGRTGNLGYARSADGVDWLRREKPLFSNEATPIEPTILWHEDSQSFEMIYLSCCSSIGLARATSLDGVEWQQDNRLFRPFVDNGLVSTGSVEYDVGTGQYHLWFVGERAAEERGVWYATSPWTEPRASFSVTPELELDPEDWILTAEFPLDFTFDATSSRSPSEGGITTYSWNFGDDTEAVGAQVTHTYAAPGEYRIVLSVTDAAGNTGRVGRRVRLFVPSIFRRGDLNGDGVHELADGVAILHALFFGGRAPECGKSADSDDSGDLTLTDGVYLLNYLFLGEAPPPAPFPDCGVDPTPDGLACEGDRACQG